MLFAAFLAEIGMANNLFENGINSKGIIDIVITI